MSKSGFDRTISLFGLIIGIIGLGAAVARDEVRCIMGLELECDFPLFASPSASVDSSVNTPQPAHIPQAPSETPQTEAATTPPTPEAEPSPSPSVIPEPPTPSPYTLAKDQAQSAASISQVAKTPQEWQTAANQWQEAIDLMKSVPKSSPNYEAAQKELSDYQVSWEEARNKAQVQDTEKEKKTLFKEDLESSGGEEMKVDPEQGKEE